jgi:hypothetical protein
VTPQYARDAITPEQRLDILRAADTFRKWYSLDDKRACVVCERVFTGRQIEIERDQRGRYLLKCPTSGCPSFAAHWFFTGNAAQAAAHVLHDNVKSGGSGLQPHA